MSAARFCFRVVREDMIIVIIRYPVPSPIGREMTRNLRVTSERAIMEGLAAAAEIEL